MVNSGKKKKGAQVSKQGQSDAVSQEHIITARRRIILAAGLLLLLFGVFFTLSVISYCLSWQQDQNLLMSSSGLSHFVFQDSTPVANWCGRFGAGIAHLLVFQGVGIAALLFTLWIGGIGINLVYGKKILPTIKWVRWMALGFLFICPLLSFVLPGSSFPLGGALGNGLVEWTNGFAGKAGTVIMLVAVLTFFVIIVFQWDIKPLLLSARKMLPVRERNVRSADIHEEKNIIYGEDVAADIANEEDYGYLVSRDTEPHTVSTSNNKLKENNDGAALMIEEDLLQDMEMIVVDKTMPLPAAIQEELVPKTLQKEGITLELPQENEMPFPEDAASDEADDELNEEEDIPIAEDAGEAEGMTEDEVMMDFEVKTVEEEKVIPAHGAHISIQSGEPYDPALDLPSFKFPTLDLLDDRDQGTIALDREELEKNKNQIILTLRSFGIEIQRISATIGPTVTLYEIIPAEGVRISKIRNLEDDIALNLAALGIRIIAPIPGRGTIGIEVPNTNKQMVSMRTLLSSEKFVNNKMSLPIALGKKIDNENYIVDLATMPHLLMAGATGQGKSVGINAILVSLLYKKHPSQLKFVMVDPKKVELSVYRLIEKHYLAKLPNEEEAIITDTKKVINTVNALCIEMDNRYELLKDAGARNIKEYNDKFIRRRLNPNHGHKYLPFIVLVIDEFADLIMTAGKEVEMPVARLAQLARAVGIHIIIATQRPSVNVITGIIKANFPARIAFKVSAKVDSRTILDAGGAEQLIGRGDMLVSHGSELLRLQCAFVDTPEVERIVEFIGEQAGYPSAFELPEYEGAEDDREAKESIDLSKRDKMFDECARLVVNSQSGSTSMLQRKFNLGYNRAGRIMDQLEAAGIVGAASGSKPRDVLIKTEYELDQHLQSLF